MRSCIRLEIDFRALSPTTAATYSARDGTQIRAYLTLPQNRAPKGLPLVIMPHGGPYGVRDTMEYNDWVQLLASRGYAVLQPNFRGSGGYGKAFFELGNGEIGRGMQDDLDDAMDWAVSEGYVDPARVCLAGGSYGGYAALWGAIRNPERYRCAVSFAGPTDLEAQLRFDQDYFNNRKRHRNWRARVRGDDKGFDLDSVSPANQVARLSRPVLLVHGKKDKRVPFDQYERMVKAAKSAARPIETLELDDGHHLSEEENEEAFLEAMMTFLKKHNPPT